MKKITYHTPVVEITRWNTQDIITTSGNTLKRHDASVVSNLGDSNVTVSVDCKTYQE